MEYVRIYVSLFYHFCVSVASDKNVVLAADFPSDLHSVHRNENRLLQTMSRNVSTKTSLTAEVWMCAFTICQGLH